MAISILSAPQEPVKQVVPITATWQIDTKNPGTCVLVLESTEQFDVTVTHHGIQDYPLRNEYHDGLWSVVIAGLTALHLVRVWNGQVAAIHSCAVQEGGW